MTNATEQTSPKPSRAKRFARQAAAPGIPTTETLQADPEGGAPAPTTVSKIDQVLALLRRGEGATLAEITEITGWLPHSARAALTGLRKKGHAIEKTKRGEVTCYAITADA